MSEATVGIAASIGPLPATWLPIQSFAGVEGISRLHRFELQVETPIPAPVLEAVALGSTATLSIRSAGHDRHVHGMISSIRREDTTVVSAPTHAVYTLRLVPRAWLLTRRRGSRIFQDMSIVEVIDAVLDEYDLPRVWQLAQTRPKRPYVTQYEESDWELVCRLAAENGILFHFGHPEVGLDAAVDALLGSPSSAATNIAAAIAGFAFDTLAPQYATREVITFMDQAGYVPIDGGMLSYLASGASAPGHDYVTKVTSRRAVRSTATKFIEYDWRRPLSKIESTAAVTEPSPLPRPGVGLAGEPLDLEVYEHRARDVEPDWADAAYEAPRMLAMARRRGVVLRGESSSARLVPGRQFILEGHGLEDGAYALTRVRHTGRRGSDGAPAYSNRFDAVPSHVVYLSPVPPKRNVQSHLTAIVAGTDGKEIHVNESGQIKVKFHWDRRDENEEPSCWLRCMQPWAGKGWGFQFIPRIGMEVVVGFEAGDPDRPLVLGTVYNAVRPEPFTLPQGATRSGIRTNSTPSNGGFNELSFEDSANNEQIFLRAQRDFDLAVLRDRTADVARDDKGVIGGSQSIEVGVDRRVEVERDQEIIVQRNAREQTVGDHRVTRGVLESHIQEDRTDYIDGMHEVHVRGARAMHTHRWQVDRVDGNSTHLVGHGAEGGHWAVDVRGCGEIHSSKTIDISAKDEIMLRVGDSFIRIGSDAIEIGSPELTLRGKNTRILLADGKCKVYGKSGIQGVSDAGIILKAGQGASLGLASEAKLDGTKVLLNSPSQASDSLEVEEPTRTTIVVRDDEGNTLPHTRFRATFSDGSVQMGATDENGEAVVEGEGEIELELGDHTDPEQE